jgi:hypothetical protein
MALPATPIVKINLTGGASFATPFILDTSQLDFGLLGEPGQIVVDVSNQVSKIDTRKARNLFQDKYLAGTATVRILDQNGDWNPQNTSSPYYPNLVPLRSIIIETEYSGTVYPIFKGYIQEYLYTYPVDQEELGYVDLICSDAFRLLFNSNVTTVTGATAGQGTGTRIDKILDTIGWPTSSRSIMTGNTLCQADPATTRTALAAIETATFTEQGAFYFDKAGNAVFKDRTFVYESAADTPTVFSNATGSTAIPYAGITFALDDKTIVNQASVTRTGGTTQIASNQDSIDKFFLHSITANDMLMQTDAEALDLARNFVASRKDTALRIETITLDLVTLGYGAGVTAALDLDYFDPMQITNVNVAGTTIVKTLQCQGIAHSITPNTWRTTLTTQENVLDGFILDSTLYGILDTSVLAY